MKKQVTSKLNISVMEQIQNGKLNMKPKSYFVVSAIVSIAAIIFASLTTAYLSSIVFFWLKIQQSETMAWGARANLSDLIASFPWWALFMAIILFVSAVILIRNQGRMYRHKTISIIIVLLTFSILIGFGMSTLSLNNSHEPSRFNGHGQLRNIR